MNSDHDWMLRLAVLATLVKNAPVKPGRTALMKFAYLLQTVRQVPLGYRFELYTYGPYDVTVLSDVSRAGTLKAVKSQTVQFNSGYAYEYTVNEQGYAKLCKRAGVDLAKYQADINWVLAEFGSDSASRLELISTIVFAEREMQRKKQPRLSRELCSRVKGIKPHFTDDTISATVDELVEKSLISLD